MQTIEVTEARSRAERDAFIKFPWQIYLNDPAWVPPLIIERKTFLDRKKHPFFEHGDAALFLARSEGKIVGRIMASDDPNYNFLHGTNTGCFGLFEAIQDRDVASALLRATAGWLRARGRDEVMGPIDYSTNYMCGLLIEGFDQPPTVLTSHNPSYYAALLQSCGFEKVKDFFAWWLADRTEALHRLRRFADRIKPRQRATIRSADLSKIGEESRRVREVYNAAWSKNWGFVPFTPKEFEFMANELKPILQPGFILIAEIDGTAAGFILCVPDINVAIRHVTDGRLTRFGLPIGLAKLLYYKRRIKTVRLVALGVVPEYRRHGLAEMLVLRAIESVMIKRGFTEGECSLVLEDNRLMNRFLEAIGAVKYKTYRIFGRRLDD
ncbi:MAG: GNAT family N-acetyltransferase [Chthoniobacterales bacterium]|nr:GNAT family N-acetyltransferase [Chthoniobacterales bacterium]